MSLQNLKNFTTQLNDPRNNRIIVDPYATFEFRFIKIDSRSAGIPDSYLNNIDFHTYIKSINDIEISTNQNTLDLPGMKYTLHRLLPSQSSGPNLSVKWLNTANPFIETVIIPWMQDVTINGNFPIPKCNIELRIPHTKQANSTRRSNNLISYMYYGARPVEADLFKMSNEPNTEYYRIINFTYDYFDIV